MARSRLRHPIATFVSATSVAVSAACGGAADVPATRPGIAPTASSARADAGPDRPYSVQLHVHGSFSEGIGSIDSHSFEASGVGADVIWWSDHDFRIGSYRHASTFGFEDWTEPLARNEPWQGSYGGREKGVSRAPLAPAPETAGAELTAVAADEGKRSLRLHATSETQELARYRHEIKADRGLFKRPLASRVELEISVLPEESGADAHPIVELVLSEHAPHGALGLSSYRIRYVLENGPDAPTRIGEALEVPVAYRPGEWNRLRLPVTQDAIAGFPWIEGEDNSLAAILIGVEVRRGARASALFDRLAIRQELAGADAFARQAELIGAVSRRYPTLAELQGVEISFASRHLNEFSVGTELLDYDAIAAAREPSRRDSDRDEVARRAVDAAHGRGGLVSYNHMFGNGLPGDEPEATREEILARLLENRLDGADLLEVGYRDRGGHPLADHLWIWDEIALGGLHPVGIGVSDSHGGADQRWATSRNNFVSWVYARGPGKPELIEGLRAGRVFFGDIVRFDGALDLATGTGFRMGQVVVTDRTSEELEVAIEGAAAGDVLRVIRAGGVAAELPVERDRAALRQTLALDPERPTAVRAEIHDARGEVKVLSNPITFVRAVPPGGITAARAGIDIGGVGSRYIDRLHLEEVELRRGANGGSELRIRGAADGGTVELDASGLGAPPTVKLEGLSGDWSYDPPLLRLAHLTGRGWISVAGTPEGRPTPPAPAGTAAAS